MKRTPLLRKTRLRSKRKDPISQREKHAMAAFHKAAMRQRCVECGKNKWEARLAGTKLQAHHGVPKEKLKQVAFGRGLNVTATLWDPRNAVAACEEPCHRRHTTAIHRLSRAKLPRPVFEFAEELGLSYVLDRHYY